VAEIAAAASVAVAALEVAPKEEEDEEEEAVGPELSSSFVMEFVAKAQPPG
jgi:hypothetical protein